MESNFADSSRVFSFPAPSPAKNIEIAARGSSSGWADGRAWKRLATTLSDRGLTPRKTRRSQADWAAQNTRRSLSKTDRLDSTMERSGQARAAARAWAACFE